MQPVAVLDLVDFALTRHGAIDSHRYDAHSGSVEAMAPAVVGRGLRRGTGLEGGLSHGEWAPTLRPAPPRRSNP
jgi:hypothetical protein